MHPDPGGIRLAGGSAGSALEATWPPLGPRLWAVAVTYASAFLLVSCDDTNRCGHEAGEEPRGWKSPSVCSSRPVTYRRGGRPPPAIAYGVPGGPVDS